MLREPFTETRDSLLRQGETFRLPAEYLLERQAELEPVHELVRNWCGVEQIERFDETCNV